MKLAILGSTGFIDTLLIQKALSQGRQVKALTRSPEKLGGLKDKVEVVRGEVIYLTQVGRYIAHVTVNYYL